MSLGMRTYLWSFWGEHPYIVLVLRSVGYVFKPPDGKYNDSNNSNPTVDAFLSPSVHSNCVISKLSIISTTHCHVQDFTQTVEL